MNGNIKSFIETASEFISTPPAELAAILLVDTLQREERIFPSSLAHYVETNYYDKEAVQAAMEALGWLIAEGFLVPDYNAGASGAYRLTREARKAVTQEDINELIRARQALPRHLHALVIKHAVPIFRSGNYVDAVAAAFKQVEIKVRDSANLSSQVGVSLMNNAFSPTKPGVLCDPSIDGGEQQGIMSLFSGAMGIFRNPAAHRNIVLSSHQAAQMLVFASLLLETAEHLIVEARAAGRIS
ncbi:MAG: TIGR02391 family protein [Cyanobacteria bacterium SZAS LIN-3]|nr:TIGR02391 family protein [Cyanobacteria bacterium SZAS LIN-3]